MKKKCPFVIWLSKQKSSDPLRPGTGWTIEEFIENAKWRECHVTFTSAYKWRRGVIPRNRKELQESFPDIKF